MLSDFYINFKCTNESYTHDLFMFAQVSWIHFAYSLGFARSPFSLSLSIPPSLSLSLSLYPSPSLSLSLSPLAFSLVVFPSFVLSQMPSFSFFSLKIISGETESYVQDAYKC